MPIWNVLCFFEIVPNFTTVLLFISAVGSLRYCKMNSLALWTVLVQTCLFVCSVLSGEDFYSQLGVERSATTREIRRAFKKLALTEHPDKNIVSTYLVNSGFS